MPSLTAESSDIRKLDSSDRETLDRDEALDEPPPPTPADTADAFAEFEDELDGENTRIDDSTLLAEASTAIIEDAPAQPFLFVERGKDEGREFVLQEGENAVGRGIDNDVILADVAVSRRHLIVIREGELLRLKDLGSGNGTILNGKKMTSAALVEGDRLELGETTLVVRQPGASLGAVDPYSDGQELTDEATIAESLPSPGPTPVAGASPNQSMSSMTHPAVRSGFQAGSIVIPRPVFVAILAGGALLLTMFGAAVAVLALRDSRGSTPTVAVDAQSNYHRGLQAFNRGSYLEASAAFRAAIQAGEDEEHDDLREYAQRAQAAAEDARILEEAESQLAEQPAQALNSAQSVDRDGPLRVRAQRVITRAQQIQISALELQFNEAREASDYRGMQRAEQAATHVNAEDPRVAEMRRSLAEMHPEFGGAAPPPAQEPETLPPPDETPPEEANPADEEAGSASGAVAVAEQANPPARRGRSRRARRGGRGASVSAAQRTAINQYLARQFAEGARTARAGARRARGAERNRLNQLAAKIERFGTLWRQIERANYAPSVAAQMSQAIGLDRQIARNTQYRRALVGRLVQAHLTTARRARDSVRRCGAVRSALRVDSGNSEARRMSRACVTEGRRLMAQAAQTSRSSPAQAIRTYQRVLQLVPPDDPVANSARGRMADLRRRHVQDEDE